MCNIRVCATIYFGLALTAFAAARAAAQTRILNGNKAPFLPFVVSIQTILYPPHFDHWCTGTLIDADRVLTAYHCFVNATDTWQWRVLPGSPEPSSPTAPTISFTKEDVIFDSENFVESTRAADWAIIQLPSAFNLSSGVIETVQLPAEDFKIEGKPLLRVVGWGETQCGQYATTLQEAYGLPVSQDVCKIPYEDRGWYGHVHDYSICAKFWGGAQGAADADDGAPLLTMDGVQVGVFTNGYKDANYCYDPEVPQIFTSTAGLIVTVAVALGLLRFNVISPTFPTIRCKANATNDPDISHKYKGDTVTNSVIASISLLLPLFELLIAEWFMKS